MKKNVEQAKKWGISTKIAEVPQMQTVDTLNFHDKCKLTLFKFNNKWGCAQSIELANQGWGFGCYPKFCDPYDSKEMAIYAAVTTIKKRVIEIGDKRNSDLLKALEKLLQPTLF